MATQHKSTKDVSVPDSFLERLAVLSLTLIALSEILLVMPASQQLRWGGRNWGNKRVFWAWKHKEGLEFPANRVPSSYFQLSSDLSKSMFFFFKSEGTES
jgi:hypothetical protein